MDDTITSEDSLEHVVLIFLGKSHLDHKGSSWHKLNSVGRLVVKRSFLDLLIVTLQKFSYKLIRKTTAFFNLHTKRP